MPDGTIESFALELVHATLVFSCPHAPLSQPDVLANGEDSEAQTIDLELMIII